MSINKTTLLGHVCAKPRITTFEGGGKVANFSIATTERGYKLTDGREVPEHTEYHNIVVNRPRLADVIETYVGRGDKIYIEGKIRSRTYGDDKTGKHRIFEIIADTIELLEHQ